MAQLDIDGTRERFDYTFTEFLRSDKARNHSSGLVRAFVLEATARRIPNPRSFANLAAIMTRENYASSLDYAYRAWRMYVAIAREKQAAQPKGGAA